MEDDLPNSWVTVSLTQVGDSVTGNTPPTKNPGNYGNVIPFVKPPELINKSVSSASSSLSSIGSAIARVLPEFSVLVSCIGNLGRVAINRIPVAFNQQINAIIPNSAIEPFYLFYQAQSPGFRNQLEEKASATTIPIVNKGNFQTIQVPLPPLNEQKRIVQKIEELFSELDAGVASLRQARAQLGVYRQSLLKQAFEGKLTEKWRAEHPEQIEPADQLLERIRTERETRYQQQLNDWQAAVQEWEAEGKEGKKPAKPRKPKQVEFIAEEKLLELPPKPLCWIWLYLGDITDIGTGMSVSQARTYVDPVEVPYLRVANVQRGVLKLNEMRTMLVERSRLGELKLRSDDILFNEGGDRDKLGRGWVWKGQIEPCITQNHVFRATPVSIGIINPEFV
jgi:type I restriction enzyme S subunit